MSQDKSVTKQEMEARFEKQEVMLEERLEQQTKELKDYVDKKIDGAVEEMTRQFNAGIEIIRDDFKGAYHDNISLLENKVDVHEERITVLEQRGGLRAE